MGELLSELAALFLLAGVVIFAGVLIILSGALALVQEAFFGGGPLKGLV